MKETFITRGGIHVERVQETVAVETALDDVYQHIDRARGCILASDYEYPGRYSRWDIGFVDPSFELVSRGRDFSLRYFAPGGDRGAGNREDTSGRERFDRVGRWRPGRLHRDR